MRPNSLALSSICLPDFPHNVLTHVFPLLHNVFYIIVPLRLSTLVRSMYVSVLQAPIAYCDKKMHLACSNWGNLISWYSLWEHSRLKFAYIKSTMSSCCQKFSYKWMTQADTSIISLFPPTFMPFSALKREKFACNSLETAAKLYQRNLVQLDTVSLYFISTLSPISFHSCILSLPPVWLCSSRLSHIHNNFNFAHISLAAT